MKLVSINLIAVAFALFTTTSAVAQNTFPANGSAGIGTNAPTQKLQIVGGNILLDMSDGPASRGNIFFGGLTYPAGNIGMRMSYYSSSAFSHGFIDVRTTAPTDGLVFRIDNVAGQNSERMRICANGNVGIGAVPGAYKLYVNGNSYIAGSQMVASDGRFKKDIQTLNGSLAIVSLLRGVQYQYKQGEIADHNFTGGKTDGFIAQEVREVLPELVQEGSDGYLAVNYLGVIPVLTEAVKELRIEKDKNIATLEARLVEKDRQIATLEARLGQIEQNLMKVTPKENTMKRSVKNK